MYVPLYQWFGPDAVARLEGMFGLAVWDDARGRLVLARDRAGEKPLFWTEVAGELRFASEVQALLVYPDQPRRVNPEAVALYAALGYAEAVTHSIRTIHHVVTADGPALERAFEVVTRSLAEPMGDPAILPTFLLAEAAREHVKVVLSGEGADELFGGYPTYLGHKAAGLYRRLPGRAALAGLVNRLPTSTGKVPFEFLLKELVAAADLPPHGTALVPRRTHGAAVGRAPVGETEPRPQAVAAAHGGAVGRAVERGYDRGRGGLTPGPRPGVVDTTAVGVG